MARYCYTPLKTAHSVRIITLQPGIRRERLTCTLDEVVLDDKPYYEAISYVWGDPSNPTSIVCDNRSLCVTQNLAAALFQFRQPDEPRRLWADAICINQDDIAERGHQVRIMGRVYAESSCVLVWLGQEDHYTQLISKLLSTILYDKNWSYPEILAIRHFFRLPWFHRAWTFQESVLARETKFHIGTYRFPRAVITERKISKARSLVEYRGGDDFYHNTDQAEAMMISSYTNTYDIGDLLSLRRGAQCKDQRDLIYSLLGVASTTAGIEPDYSRSIQDVFTITTRQIIASRQSLSVLREVDTSELDASLPSWVPDWRKRFRGNTFPKSKSEGCWNVGAGLAQLAPFHREIPNQPTHLGVRGVCVDEIEEQVDGKSGDSLVSFVALFDGQKFDRYTIEPIELAFLRTMSLDYVLPDERWPSRRSEWEHQFKVDDFYELVFPPWHQQVCSRFEAHVRMATCEGNLFRSKDRLMGLAPGRSRPGDIICIIAGIDTPVLLRPSGREYLFIGHCYVYGLMAGRRALVHMRREKLRSKYLPPEANDDEDMSWLWDAPSPHEIQEFILK